MVKRGKISYKKKGSKFIGNREIFNDFKRKKNELDFLVGVLC